MDELLDKNSEGSITPDELVRLEQLVAEAEQNMLANLKRMAEFARSEEPRAPAAAVPVTVWVQAEPAKR